MCWQSTILNKQIATEDIPVRKICELYYPFAVLHSRDEIFYKSPCHSFVYSFSPAEKVNLVVNTHKGSKEFLSGKTYYTIEAGYHCQNYHQFLIIQKLICFLNVNLLVMKDMNY